MCTLQPIVCCTTSRPQSSGWLWASTSAGGMGSEPCFGNGRATLSRRSTSNPATAPDLLLRPRSQQTPDVHQLGQMIGIVIGNQQNFAQDRLAVAPWNAGVQIRFRIGD